MQVTTTSGKKSFSIVFTPFKPRIFLQTLNEKRPAIYPRTLAACKSANRFLISENTPIYVAAFDLGVLPIGA